MKRKNNKIHGILKQSIIFSIIFFSIIIFANAASAADMTYYWIPSSGDVGSSGYTADWGNCNAQPTSYRITTLSSTGFICNSDRLTTTSSGNQYLAIFPTAYSSDTQITGKTGATFYLSSQRSGYTATYRFDLGYASSGAFTSLGYVTRTVSSSNGQSYTIDLSSITGTAPAGSYLALQVSVTTSRGGRVYLGTNGGSTGSNSGRFYVNETAAIPPAPAYNVTIIASPASAVITQGGNYTYDITLNNNGNTNGDYTLAVSDSDSTNFVTPSVLDRTSIYVPAGGSNTTTLSVTARSTAAGGASDTTTITATSIQDPSYADSTTATTTTIQSGYSISAQSQGKIFVTTNRYVVLDDPISGSFSGIGFKNPSRSWGTNYFNSVETNITMWAMVINVNGLPVANTNVNFTLENPGGATDYTIIKSTDSNGLVNITRDLNAKNYYGNWKVTADAPSLGVNGSTSFIYNWWGCGGGAGCSGHSSKSLTSGAPINSPYTTGHDAVVNRNSAHKSANICMYCHLSYSGSGSSPSMNTSDVHKDLKCDNPSCHGSITQHSTNMVIGSCSNCHNRTDISRKTTLNGIVSNYSTTSDYHDNNSTIPCIICHGPMHNITKPDESQRFVKNNITEDSQCITCHQNYNKHNTSVNCTLCHSGDVHNIKVFSQSAGYVNHGSPAQGNCTSCHQNSTFLETLNSTPTAGNYFGKPAPQIPDPLRHSANLSNGTMWGQFWTSKTGSCYFCHGDTKHNSTAIGLVNALLFSDPPNMRNGLITTTTWCADCHYNNSVNTGYRGNLWNPDPPLITVDNTGKPGWVNHSGFLGNGYKDSDCQSCHSLNGTFSLTSLNLSHSLNEGMSGGPNCIGCHDAGSTLGGGKLVNFSAMNTTGAIHKNLNSGATTTLSAENKKCWACHGNGNEPASGHPSNYRTPYKCVDCHVSGLGSFNPPSILTVNQHYWNGTNITTSGVTSCYSCHNTSEMMVGTNLDPDGTGSIYGGANGGNNSTSHYGKNRPDLSSMSGTNLYCTYCHNSTVNGATFYVNSGNNSIVNHSTSDNTPSCNNCHSTGRLHDSGLVKPASSNDSYCKTCHGTKNEHKTLYCTECHANNTDGSKAGKEIHGIKYLQKDNTFSTGKTNAVDCTTCHQSSVVDSSLGITPVKVSNPLHHSDGVLNGSKWGSYWTNQIGACLYCHNDTKHSSTPLGRPLAWNPSYVLNSPIGTGTNCADCHYQGDSNYSVMISTFTGAGLNISPEITSGSWNGKPGYYNHTLSEFTDTQCKSCHYQGPGTNVGDMLHSTSEGIAGGADCKSCHDTGGIAPKHVNFNDMNSTSAVHKNLNSDASASVDVENKKCWACHGDGTEPVSGHPSGYRTPKACIDCHESGTFKIDNHRSGGVNISTAASCANCHNNSVIRFESSENASMSHYGTKTNLISTIDCMGCHKNLTNAIKWGNATDPSNSPTFPHSLSTTTKEECYSCHGDISTSDFHNVTLKKPPLASVTCDDCHKLGTNLSLTKIDSEISSLAVHKNKACSDCHINATNSNMNGYKVSSNPPVSCTICHLNLEHQPAAPDVQTTITCQNCHNNSGMYTANSGTNGTGNAVVHYLKDVTNNATTPYGHLGPIDTTNCIICHRGQYTNDSAWGSPVNISTSSKRQHTETTNAQCDTCHKDSSVQTLANVDFHNSALTAGAGGADCLDCHAGAE